MQPHADAASTLLGTVLSIKTQYRHLVFPPKSGGEMSQPATGHDAPSPRHPGHCDDSVTGQYVNSLSGCRACQPASRHGRTLLSVLLPPAGSCWSRRCTVNQHTMQPGRPAASFFPRPSLLFLQVWGLQLLPPRRQRWQKLGTRVRTYAHPHIRVHIQYRPGLSHTISGPTLDYAPRNAAKQAAHHPRRSAYQPAGPV